MGGYRRGNIGFNISHISCRKKPCIWLEKDNQSYLVGSFKTDQDAEDFLKVMRYVMTGDESDEAYKVFEGYENV